MIAANDNETAGPNTGDNLTFPDMTEIQPGVEVWIECPARVADERPTGPVYVFVPPPLPRPDLHRRRRPPGRAVAPRINRRLMPCNRLGPGAACGRKAQ